MLVRHIVLASLLAVTQAIQSSAPEAVPGRLRTLPLGQLNFLHTTDTHGWHAGHLQECVSRANADSLTNKLGHPMGRTGETTFLLLNG